MRESLAAPRRLLLYVHVPFCEQRCHYCNFAVDLRKSSALHARYVQALTTQLERTLAMLAPTTTIPGVDIGGGTPTRLDAALLELVMDALKPFASRLEHERTLSIETTPSIAATHLDRLEVLRQGGISRVSMGVQSTNAQTLAMVNRRAQREMTEGALANLARAGFERVNVDLVFGLPQQTTAHLLEDLASVIAQGVDSITIYDCLYRGEGRALPRLHASWPRPQDYAAMYDAAFALLRASGFQGDYGGLNFSRHPGETGTSPYFEGRMLDALPYLGTGNYASSMMDHHWSFAPLEVDEYMQRVESGEEVVAGDAYALPREEVAAKIVLASLNYGVIDPERFERAVGASLEGCFGEVLAVASARGWLVQHADGCWRVGAGHFDRMWALRALFYSAPALEWVARHLEVIWGDELESAQGLLT